MTRRTNQVVLGPDFGEVVKYEDSLTQSIRPDLEACVIVEKRIRAARPRPRITCLGEVDAAFSVVKFDGEFLIICRQRKSRRNSLGVKVPVRHRVAVLDALGVAVGRAQSENLVRLRDGHIDRVFFLIAEDYGVSARIIAFCSQPGEDRERAPRTGYRIVYPRIARAAEDGCAVLRNRHSPIYILRGSDAGPSFNAHEGLLNPRRISPNDKSVLDSLVNDRIAVGILERVSQGIDLELRHQVLCVGQAKDV